MALKNNSIEFDGITGGYNSLVPSDVQSAKAYKDGDYTVVEMVMVEQTDDAYGDTYKGTVGHGISVVGNIAVVALIAAAVVIGLISIEYFVYKLIKLRKK